MWEGGREKSRALTSSYEFSDRPSHSPPSLAPVGEREKEREKEEIKKKKTKIWRPASALKVEEPGSLTMLRLKSRLTALRRRKSESRWGGGGGWTSRMGNALGWRKSWQRSRHPFISLSFFAARLDCALPC